MASSSSTRRLLVTVAGIGVLCAAPVRVAHAQSAALTHALQQESSGQLRDAAISYRDALAHGEVVSALLGLERVYTQLHWIDSMVPLIDAALVRSPGEPIARAMQLRVLRSLKRDADAQSAFNAWVQAVPNDVTPYREWSRILLAEGRTAMVDTVLQDARRALGNMSGLVVELASVRVALGQWDQAAVAWRAAVTEHGYQTTAAEFSLRAAPNDSRRSVRAVLLSPPVDPAPRQLLALLELDWGNGRDAWSALRELDPGDSTAAIWTAFAEDAARRGQALPARDALMAVQMWRPDAQRALRAATLAIEGGDAASALDLVQQAETRVGPHDGPKAVLSVRLRAYAMLGRGGEAQKAFGSVQSELSPAERDAGRRAVAWAWVRSGRVAEARAALGGATADPDAELSGWLSLYDGDLAGARRGLRRADARTGDAALALAFVTRTRLARAPLSGAAFLTLARGDTAAAETAFAKAASEVPEAASVLMLTAARLYSQQHREADAVVIWKQLVDAQSTTPEAAEAELEWAKVLRGHGERTAAVAHLEHLILTWPDSALLPQARRELELAKGSIPGNRPYA